MSMAGPFNVESRYANLNYVIPLDDPAYASELDAKNGYVLLLMNRVAVRMAGIMSSIICSPRHVEFLDKTLKTIIEMLASEYEDELEELRNPNEEE